MLQYTTHSKNQLAARRMLHQLSHSREQRMVVVHSKPSLINMHGMISGKQKSASKMTYSIHEYGWADQASHWKVLSLNTLTHSYPCNSVQNTLHISLQMSTPGSGTCWRESNALTLAYKLQWRVYEQMMVQME